MPESFNDMPNESAFSASLSKLRKITAPESEAMQQYKSWQRELKHSLKRFQMPLGYAKQDIFTQLEKAIETTEKCGGKIERIFFRENIDLSQVLSQLNATIEFLSDDGALYQKFKGAGITANDQAEIANKLINSGILNPMGGGKPGEDAHLLYNYLMDRDKVAYDRESITQIRDALAATLKAAKLFNDASKDDETIIGILHNGTVSKSKRAPNVRIMDIPGEPGPLHYVSHSNERMATYLAGVGRLSGNGLYTARYENPNGKPCTYDFRVILDNGKIYTFNSGPLNVEDADGRIPPGEDGLPPQMQAYIKMRDHARGGIDGDNYNQALLEAGFAELQRRYPPAHLQPRQTSRA